MGKPVLAVAAAMACIGLAGCAKTVDGSLATTTEPGPPVTSPTVAAPPRTATTSEVPPPPNTMTMTCGEFEKLDQDTRLAVVKAILAQQPSVLGTLDDEMTESMLNAMCEYMPDRTVHEVLTGSPPP